MIPISRLTLTPGTVGVLAKRHKSAAVLASGSKNIQYRWDYFLRTDMAALGDVRTILDQMFHGKCCYCEKIIAKDIEHFYPKTLYPAKMFDWVNMLRACKDCNFEKLDADPDNPKDHLGTRSLLNPTVDRPEDYLEWDLLTGLPVYISAPGGVHRGKRTVEVCGLDNEKFNQQRRKQARRFKALLLRVMMENPVDTETSELLDDLVEPGEPWLGVIRQVIRDPKMQPLIRDVEARLPHLSTRFNALRWTHP